MIWPEILTRVEEDHELEADVFLVVDLELAHAHDDAVHLVQDVG